MKNEFKKISTDFRTGTIAYYGPNDKIVTKIVVGITVAVERNFIEARKWPLDYSLAEMDRLF